MNFIFHPNDSNMPAFWHIPQVGLPIPMPPAKNHHDETIHFQLLQTLTGSPDQNQRVLAGSMGISLGKLNFCLRALIDKGWVKAGNFNRSTNKRQYGYLLTPGRD